MLTEEAYRIAKKLCYAKANGATKEQAEKYIGHEIDDSIWSSISPLTYEKSSKHINGWVEEPK